MKDLFVRPLDSQYVSALASQLEALGASAEKIGESLQGRPITVFRAGRGKKVLFVCTTHAAESIAGSVMLRFLCDLLYAAKTGGLAVGYRPALILSRTELHVLPLFNPDGVEIALGRVTQSDPAYEKLKFFNNGSPDFSCWQANTAGVDLNHNFDAGFAEGVRAEKAMGIFGPSPTRYGGREPFSEPETRALHYYVLAHGFERFYALHTQGEEIYCTYRGYAPPTARETARILGRVSGYKVAEPEGIASVRGAKDWFIKTCDRPGFTVELGRGTNPLPLSDAREIYRKAGEMLALACLL